MKLKEILEANTYSVDPVDPSGTGVPTSVDPDKADEMLDPKDNRYSRVGDNHRADRSSRLRKKLQMAKKSKNPRQGGKVVSDNTDMTGSGANSSMNGNFTY